MIGSTRRLPVHAFGAPVDMRKSFDTLAALVRDGMKRELTSGELFLFVSRDRTRAKVLFWDGTGVCLFAKRLEKGRFVAPWERGEGDALTWTTSEFALFLEGCKLVGKMLLSPPPFVMSKPRDEHDPGVREGGRDAAERDDRP